MSSDRRRVSPPSEIRAKFLHSNDLEAAMRGVILELDRVRTVHLFYPRISFSFPKKFPMPTCSGVTLDLDSFVSLTFILTLYAEEKWAEWWG